MEHTFYKLDIQGIVYLVNPVNGYVYTYEFPIPTHIGSLVWNDPKAEPRVRFREDWQAVMAAKFTPPTAPITGKHDA